MLKFWRKKHEEVDEFAPQYETRWYPEDTDEWAKQDAFSEIRDLWSSDPDPQTRKGA